MFFKEIYANKMVRYTTFLGQLCKNTETIKKFLAYSIVITATLSRGEFHAAVPVSYEGSQVWRTELSYPHDIEVFNRLIADGDISTWKTGTNHTDYLVHGKDKVRVHRELRARNLNYSVLIHDVQRLIDSTRAKEQNWTEIGLRVGYRLNWKNYPTLDVIEEYLGYLNSNFESFVTVKPIGTTAENRTIKMIKISNGNPQNKAILITAGQHAREWVGITSALYIANQIISRFDDKSDYMRDKDWYIIPLLNPDGYHYSQTHDRLWRKNRRRTSVEDLCYGVDINRNFDQFWSVAAVASSRCEEDYAGPYPFSEAESKAVKNVMEQLGKNLPVAYFDLRSYGQMILYPWAGRSTPSTHKKLLDLNSQEMKTAIYNRTSQKYKSGSPGTLLYLAWGVAIDWVHHKGVNLVYAIEARDEGKYGFLLPASQIEDTGRELMAAIDVAVRNLSPAQNTSSKQIGKRIGTRLF